MITGYRRNGIIPITTPIWNITSPPFTNVVSGSNTNIWTPTVAQDRTYNHDIHLFRDGSRIYLTHCTHDQDEDSAGQYVRYVYSDDEGTTWSSYNTAITAWEPMDLTHTVNAHIPYPTANVTVNGQTYILYDVDFVVKSTEAFSGYGLLAQSITSGVFGTPVWIYGGHTDVRFSQADDGLKQQILSTLFTRGNVFQFMYCLNTLWPRSQGNTESYFSEGVSMKLHNSYWIRYSRAMNTFPTSFVYSQNSVNGVDWSYPVATVIPNSPSKLAFVQHSTGLKILIFNPFNYLSISRDPLVAVFSNDGITWNSAKTIRLIGSDTPIYAGQFKTGAAAYPSAIELNNQKILVAYSIHKELIETTTFSIT